MRLQLLAYRDSVEPGHVDVQEDEGGLIGRDRIESLDTVLALPPLRLAVPLGHDLVAVTLESRLEKLHVHRVVLNEENAQDPSPASAGVAKRSFAGPAGAARSRGGPDRSAS